MSVRLPDVFPSATSIAPTIQSTPSWMAPPLASAEPLPSFAHLRLSSPGFAAQLSHHEHAPRATSSPPASSEAAPEYNAELDALRTEMDQLRAQNEMLADALAQAAESLATLRATTIEEVEAEVVALAREIARRAVGAELEARPELIVKWVSEGLRHLVLEDGVAVHVGPKLAERVAQAVWDRVHAGVRIVVEEGASDYHCEVRTPSARLILNAENRLGAVADALEAR